MLDHHQYMLKKSPLPPPLSCQTYTDDFLICVLISPLWIQVTKFLLNQAGCNKVKYLEAFPSEFCSYSWAGEAFSLFTWCILCMELLLLDRMFLPFLLTDGQHSVSRTQIMDVSKLLPFPEGAIKLSFASILSFWVGRWYSHVDRI